MSKISEYNLSQKEFCIKQLEALCDMAISTKDFTVWHTATTYADGLEDAFRAYMDEDTVDKITSIIDDKAIKFMNELAKEEQN